MTYATHRFVNGQALCRNVPRALEEQDVVSFGAPFVTVAATKKPNPCQYRLQPTAMPKLEPTQPTMTAVGRPVVDLSEVLAGRALEHQRLIEFVEKGLALQSLGLRSRFTKWQESRSLQRMK